MPTLTVETTLSYGLGSAEGDVARRVLNTYTLTYAEKSTKTVRVAAGVTDESITLDSITKPKFLLARCLETDVDIKLSDGVTTVISSLKEGDGYLLLSHPDGQDINEIQVTTPATPAEGALVEIIAFE